MATLHRTQQSEGRFFLHEHPVGATSWQLTAVQDVMKLEGVVVTIADQCMHGLKTWSTDRAIQDIAAQTKTKFMTISGAIAEELGRQCDNSHQHHVLTCGRANGAARSPGALCEAICRGPTKEKRNKFQELRCLMTVTADTRMNPDEDHEGTCKEAMAWDDVT